jgi:hypothetical protein
MTFGTRLMRLIRHVPMVAGEDFRTLTRESFRG